jgi:surface polysaccharide O-acyltransferase-like enzyme
VLAAALWWWGRDSAGRLALFGAATAIFVWGTPFVRGLAPLAALPDPIEGYLRPIAGLTNFTFFPWIGFVTAGAAIGVVLDGARQVEADRRVNLWFAAGGAVTAYVAYGASFLPPLLAGSSFWTSSASFFFLRLGLMIAAIGLAYLWERRPGAGQRWSPLQTLGRSSLFIYWIHVEMVYGLISLPLHGAFTLPGAWAALAVFCLLMLAVAVLKNGTMSKFNRDSSLRRQPSGAAQPLMF